MPAARTVAKRKPVPRKRKGKSAVAGKPREPRDIAKAVEDLVTANGKNFTLAEQEVFSEVLSLARYIQAAREDIAALCPDEVKTQHLPAAANELDAIVKAAAQATHTIMDATEIVESAAEGTGGETADRLIVATTKIYEACGFQDITGQRVSKIIGTLKHIEEKIDAMVAAIESGDQKSGRLKPKRRMNSMPGNSIPGNSIPGKSRMGNSKAAKSKKKLSDEDLLNGPQLENAAKSQAEIDTLMESFE